MRTRHQGVIALRIGGGRTSPAPAEQPRGYGEAGGAEQERAKRRQDEGVRLLGCRRVDTRVVGRRDRGGGLRCSMPGGVREERTRPNPGAGVDWSVPRHETWSLPLLSDRPPAHRDGLQRLQEVTERQKVITNAFLVSLLDLSRNYKLDASTSHLPELVITQSMLKRQKVLLGNAICLGKDLAPTIPTGGLDSQHSQVASRVSFITIRGLRRENEIWAIGPFGDTIMVKVRTFDKTILNQYLPDVQFQ